MVTDFPSIDQVWHWLDDVPDPEIPVISVTDLGIVRDVRWDSDTLVVTVTPTYSGCPAASIINLDIAATLHRHGVANVRLERQLSPPWTTDWIGPEAQEKLRRYGIAPPNPGGAVACPQCGAEQVEKISEFGSTPCKAVYRCRECLEPFDYFKCI